MIMMMICFTLVQSSPIFQRQDGSLTDDEKFSYCIYNSNSPSASIVTLARKCLIEVTGVTIQDPPNR
ncbi:unnamed protein product [Cunninghamella blakesleeana]